MSSRSPSHAGDWYTDNPSKLDAQLDQWLAQVPFTPLPGCKAVVAPHAGYSYSGPAAAWAYKNIDTTGIKRVFILGPSHHVYIDGCALSKCTEYKTPIGALPLDTQTIDELSEHFSFLSLSEDEAEHSIEMHLPYIRKVFQNKDILIVPIVVGAISQSSEARFGAILAPHLSRPDTFTVVSSDFCHWGTRFSYTFYYPAPADAAGVRISKTVSPTKDHPIHESIRKLDHEAMDLLVLPTAHDAHTNFASYLARTKNTICGRHPIGVLLGAITALEKEGTIAAESSIEWVRYEQSSACVSVRDSSVSYASARVKF